MILFTEQQQTLTFCLSQGMMNKMRLAGPDVLNSGNLFVQTRQPDQRVFETKTVISFIIIPIILSWL